MCSLEDILGGAVRTSESMRCQLLEMIRSFTLKVICRMGLVSPALPVTMPKSSEAETPPHLLRLCAGNRSGVSTESG
jgi:hypothetical protein